MGADAEGSLNDEATSAGSSRLRGRADSRLGDEPTRGESGSDQKVENDAGAAFDFWSRYRSEGTLGEGGMGAVLLATDTRLDRKVAIKRIQSEAAGSRRMVRRFLTEARAIAALNHPNIIQVFDYVQVEGGPYLIMEYVDGGSLLDRCRETALPLGEAIEFACCICDGLSKAHDLGIIHRDIKPANVLLTRDGIPKLTDFGLAKMKVKCRDHGQTLAGAVMGTPDFMPPEQRLDASLVDQRSDLWSLAATVYQMVTGRNPRIIRFDDVPDALHGVLAKALEDRKEDRYQSAPELRDALLQAGGGQAGSPPTQWHVAHDDAAVIDDVSTEGRCNACCRINTDLSRKFCRSCGSPLRAACLGCGDQIPVWDGICGECGGHQGKIRESLRQAAVRHVVEILNTRVVPQKAAHMLAQAKTHCVNHDHRSAIHVIESIPETIRCGEARALMARCMSRIEEAGRLIETVRVRAAAGDLDGLLPAVEMVLELQGETDEFMRLRRTLVDRSRAARRREQHALRAVRRQLRDELMAARKAREQKILSDWVEAGLEAEETRCRFDTTAGPIVVVVHRSWSVGASVWFASAVKAGAFGVAVVRAMARPLPPIGGYASGHAVSWDLLDLDSDAIDPAFCITPAFPPPAGHKRFRASQQTRAERWSEPRSLVAVRTPSDLAAGLSVVFNSSGHGCETVIGWIDQAASAEALRIFRETRVRQMGVPDAAVGVLMSARLVSSPGVEDLESRLEQGRCLAEESRWEELSELLEAAVADHPKARKAWIGWGKALKKLGRFEEGAAVMGRAFAANPRSAVFLYNRACFLAGSGHTGPAVECLAKAIAMQPAWQEAAKQDDDFAAIQRDRRFLAAVSHRDPARRLQAKLQRGLTLFERGRYAGAVPVLEAFTEQHPHVLDAWLVIGRCLKELRRPDDAAEAMRRGLEACGRHPRLMYNLACYECLAGRCDEALRALLDAISLHPAYAGVVERDADLDALRSDPRFAAIVSVAGGSWRLREE